MNLNQSRYFDKTESRNKKSIQDGGRVPRCGNTLIYTQAQPPSTIKKKQRPVCHPKMS